jgi:2-polyprenyl-6-methoxyphenol hydroxylase-like FAD-dependent oxidoreductase
MAAAIALSRDSHDVTLFERFAEPQPLGAGLLLQPTGLEALAALGLRDEIEALGARVTHLRGHTPGGRRVLDLAYADWSPNAYGVGIHRATLFNTLFAALARSPTRFVPNTEIVRIDEPPRPVLRDASGQAHGPFDLVIVADGSASTLRPQIVPHAKAPLYPWGAIWTIVPDPENKWANVLAQVYHGARVMIGVMPVGAAPGARGGHVTFFWSLREDEYDAWRASGLHHWRARIAARWPEAAALLEGIDFASLNFARYRDVQAWPWGSGATLLIGDCAHATSPQLGQGANLALVDAVTLAHALRLDTPISVALEWYRHARAGKVAWVQFMSAALTPLYQSRSSMMGWFRDWIMTPLAKLRPINRLMLSTLVGAGSLPFAWTLSRAAKFLLFGRPKS